MYISGVSGANFEQINILFLCFNCRLLKSKLRLVSKRFRSFSLQRSTEWLLSYCRSKVLLTEKTIR